MKTVARAWWKHSLPWPQTTSVEELSIFKPLPSQKLREASTLGPDEVPFLVSPSSGSITFKIRRAFGTVVSLSTNDERNGKRDPHSRPETTHLSPSSDLAIVPPPLVAARGKRALLDGPPWGPGGVCTPARKSVALGMGGNGCCSDGTKSMICRFAKEFHGEYFMPRPLRASSKRELNDGESGKDGAATGPFTILALVTHIFGEGRQYKPASWDLTTSRTTRTISP